MITSAASSTSIETASARSDPSGQLTEGIRIDYVNAPIFVPPSRPQEFRMGPLLNGQFAFFQEFLKHPLQIGSVIPSSRFLERRILEASGAASAESIVELGSGTGGTTRAILNEMPRHARLLSIEINPQLHASVRKISDDRLIAHLGNACELKKILGLYDMDRPDVVISGIPFSTMSHRSGAQVVAAGAQRPLCGVPGAEAGRRTVPTLPGVRADGGGASQHPAGAGLPVGEERPVASKQHLTEGRLCG
jgi:phospholipid N-methyltransferase